MNQAVEAIKTYFKGVKAEWGRISWPEKNQVAAETMAVVAIVFAFTIAIYVIDLIFKGLLSFIK
ncbi:preprotein translocase subunit SecE [bacterium]|nr:preprotein translocase subunit SecE [bacterium]